MSRNMHTNEVVCALRGNPDDVIGSKHTDIIMRMIVKLNYSIDIHVIFKEFTNNLQF